MLFLQMGFMSELCFCSHKELITLLPRRGNATPHAKTKGRSGPPLPLVSLSCQSTLLYPRLVEVMLQCVKSGRPMLHLVKAWAIVGTHLMEVGSVSSPKAL